VGAAALAPFAGMIGQERLRHDPHYNRSIRRVATHGELARLARPGDVVLHTDPDRNFFRQFSTANSGSEFYHTLSVHGERGGKPIAAIADDFADSPKVDALRGATPQRIRRNAWTLREMLKDQGDVDAVILRPRKGMDPKVLQRYLDDVAVRSAQPYNMGRATSAGAADIFLPKIKGLETLGPASACEGEICSTLPAQASAAAGRPHITGKRPKDVLPSDYLRSKDFKAVAARTKMPKPTLLRRASPYLLRAGLGAGLAGSTYLASEYPEAVATAGGVAGGAALSGLIAKRLGAKVPTVMGAAVRAMGGRMDRDYAKAFAATRLPGAILGGLGTYLAAKQLRAYLTDRREETPPVG